MKEIIAFFKQLTIRKVIDYIKFVIAIVLLYSMSWAWKTYDVVGIPIDNFQMSPSFEPKEFHVGIRFSQWDNITYGSVVYYNYPHHKIRARKDCLMFARVVGLPGDLISIKKGQLYRNGKAIDEPYVAKDNLDMDNSYGEVMVPRNHAYLLVDHRRRFAKDVYYKDSRFFGPILLYTLQGEIKPKS